MNVKLSVAFAPGEMVAVTFPAHAFLAMLPLGLEQILKVCGSAAVAEFVILKRTAPCGITFGATVTLVDEDTDEKKVWQIVGEPEADAKKGKISVTSPLAKALIGKTKGTSVEVNTPGGAKAYAVKKIEWR